MTPPFLLLLLSPSRLSSAYNTKKKIGIYFFHFSTACVSPLTRRRRCFVYVCVRPPLSFINHRVVKITFVYVSRQRHLERNGFFFVRVRLCVHKQLRFIDETFRVLLSSYRLYSSFKDVQVQFARPEINAPAPANFRFPNTLGHSETKSTRPIGNIRRDVKRANKHLLTTKLKNYKIKIKIRFNCVILEFRLSNN